MTDRIKNPIFILNAPKRIGKDTVATRMREFDSEIQTGSFKEQIFNIVRITLSVENSCHFFDNYDVGDWKDSPVGYLNGKTPREFLIHISENYIKPFFGNGYFGRSLADHIQEMEELYMFRECTWVIPDGGFLEEIEEMYQTFGDRVVVVHITRPGFESFTGDSRGFVNHPDVRTIEETNEDSSEALALRLMGYIDYDGDEDEEM